MTYYDLLIYDHEIYSIKSSDDYGRQEIWDKNKNKPFLWIKKQTLAYLVGIEETLTGLNYELVSKTDFITALKHVHLFFTDERLTDVVDFELYSASEKTSNYLRKRVRPHVSEEAWVEILEDGIRIGSKFNGEDVCDSFELSYPFTISELKEELATLKSQYEALKLDLEISNED